MRVLREFESHRFRHKTLNALIIQYVVNLDIAYPRGDLRADWILVCRDCRHVGRLSGGVLAKYPRAAPLDAIAARAVCRCGGREGVLGLINEAGGASSRPMRPG